MLAEQPRSRFTFCHWVTITLSNQAGDAQQYYFNATHAGADQRSSSFSIFGSEPGSSRAAKLAAQYYQQAVQLDPSGNSGFDRAQAQQRLNELTTAR